MLDKGWAGRAIAVITDLASEKMQLLKKERDMDNKILKLEFEKVMKKMHKEELKRRDKRELYFAFVVL